MSLSRESEAVFFSEKIDVQYGVSMQYDIVRSVEMSSNERRVSFVMDQNQLVMWKNIQKNKFWFSPKQHEQSSLCLKILQKSKQFITASADKSVLLWNLHTAKSVWRYKDFDNIVCYVVFGERERRAAAIDHSGSVLLFSIVERKAIKYAKKISISFWLSATFDFDFTRDLFIGPMQSSEVGLLMLNILKNKRNILSSSVETSHGSFVCLRKSRQMAFCSSINVVLLNIDTAKKRMTFSAKNQLTGRPQPPKVNIARKISSVQCVGTDSSESLLFMGTLHGAIGVFSVTKRRYLFYLKQSTSLLMVRRCCNQDYLAICGGKKNAPKIFSISKLLSLCTEEREYVLWDK